MGLLTTVRDAFLERSPDEHANPHANDPHPPVQYGTGLPIGDQIQAAIDARLARFGVADALRMPSIRRARDLTTTVGAMFDPVTYRDGQAVPNARIVARPDPYRSRYDWQRMALDSLFVTGDLFCLLGDRDSTGAPGFAIVLDPSEVFVAWDDRRFLPRYRWRNRDLVLGESIAHIALARAPGQLRGRSALADALPFLGTLAAQEEYAALFFASGGVPTTVLRAQAKLTKDEAERLKAQYIGDGTQEQVRVAGSGLDLSFPGVDPRAAQLDQARDYGNTVVARLFGIPAPLLIVNTAGSSLTYQNVGQVVHTFARQTLYPMYLSPLEALLSDLTPETDTVRFASSELERADLGTRVGIYGDLVAMGALEAQEVRQAEGWKPAQAGAPTDVVGHEPTPEPASSTAAPTEYPRP